MRESNLRPLPCQKTSLKSNVFDILVIIKYEKSQNSAFCSILAPQKGTPDRIFEIGEFEYGGGI